jgi:hypothetical protein
MSNLICKRAVDNKIKTVADYFTASSDIPDNDACIWCQLLRQLTVNGDFKLMDRGRRTCTVHYVRLYNDCFAEQL